MNVLLNKRVAIIGRGLAGLTLSFRMAKAGFKPTIFGSASGPANASRCAQGIVCNKGLIFAESPLFRAKLQTLQHLENWLLNLEKYSGMVIPRTWIGVDEPYWDEADFQKTLQRVYRGNFWGCYRPSNRSPKLWSESLENFKIPAGFMHYPDDAWFDVHATLNALEKASERLGSTFVEEKIQSLLIQPDDITLKTDTSLRTFDHIVIAAGAESLNLLKCMGVECPKFFLVGGQSLFWVNDPSQQKAARILVKGNLSLANLPSQSILGSSSWKPEANKVHDLAADREQLLGQAESAFGLPIEWLKSKPIQGSSGVRIRFADRMPALGILPDESLKARVSVLTGFYKNGLQLADLCAEQLLQELTGQSLSEFGQAFHVGRFYRQERRAPGSPPRHCSLKKQSPN